MTITTADGLINAMGNNASRLIIDKASIANTAQGQYHSLWRATGQPGQAVIPGAAAVVSNNTLGAIGFTQQTAPATSYLGILEVISPTGGVTVEIHDRLMQMGGLNATLTTAQTANVDINANLATSNLDARKGDANYSDVQWWLEWYTDTGATASNATINVTYNDGTSGNLTAVAVGGTVRASRMISLNGLIPSADSGKYIRDVNTVTLSASTGTAGSFGITATRYRAAILTTQSNFRQISSWSELGLPEIHNSSCLFAVLIANSASTGAIRATGKIIHG